MKGKRMKNAAFFGIWIPVTVVLLALGIAFVLLATTFADLMTGILGWERGAAEVVTIEGSENWDANYYSISAKSKDEATKNSNNLIEKISNEGFVLLKNDDNTLPLKNEDQKNIATYGRSFVDTIIGGTGSGYIGDSNLIKPYDALTEEGFTINPDVYKFFNDNVKNYTRGEIAMDNYQNSTFFIGEIPSDAYTGFSPVREETAIVFIGRSGGEGWDLSTDLNEAAKTKASKEAIEKNKTYNETVNYQPGQHQLELSKEEKDMIVYCNENYSKTVVVINSANAMELGPIAEGGECEADAILWIGMPGGYGYKAMANILSGAVNPSGKTVDIYASDFTADPTFKNEGVYEYTGIGEGDIDVGNGESKAYAMQYEEGIYVGYRYYETAHVEAEAGNYEGFDYDTAVVYPFGYGLSYTTFTQDITNYSTDGDEISVTVSVKNNTATAGKEVVQVYYTPPYTKGGIEKSAVNLVAFAKVEVAGNATETVTLTFKKEDMASYDYKTEKAYVLDDDKYTISIRSDSHTVIDSFEYTQNNKEVYDENNKRSTDEVAATNQFDDVSTMFRDTATTGYATNFSRSNFKGTFPTTPTADDLKAGDIKVEAQQNGGTTVKAGLAKFDVNTDPTLGNVETSEIYNNEMPIIDENNGTKLTDMKGVDYNDPAWVLLLNNIKKSEYVSETLNLSAYNTAAIDSIAKPKTYDPDGPAGISTMGADTGCAGFMCEVVLASTWNVELAREMGNALAEEAYWYGKAEGSSVGGTNGWYAPAMNTHRSPFAGRNFEYYSEDPYLSGMMGAYVVKGAAEKGVYAYIKHFALNDSEINRVNNLCVWANEQAMREIYLKPFELTIKNSDIEIKYISDDKGKISKKTIKGATAIMSSFNRIGTTWAGGNYSLMTTVLREEWGFEGVAISDFNIHSYMNADQGMRAGTDMQLSMAWNWKKFSDTESATAINAMRKAIHNMCYTVVNSNVMQGVTPGSTFIYHFAGWQTGFVTLAVFLFIFAAAAVAWIVIRNTVLKSKAPLDPTP